MRFVLLLLAVAVVPSARMAAAFDLAIQSIRVPVRVALTDARRKSIAHVAVRVTNPGDTRFTTSDESPLRGLVRLRATALDGPVACTPVAVTPDLSGVHFPVSIGRGRGRTLRFHLEFTCGPNPERTTPDWAFSAALDWELVRGAPDDDPTNDVCPRAPSGADPGCGAVGAKGARVAPVTDVRDLRVGARFEVPGPYGVGETSAVLVDSTRPTMANGSFPGAPDRTLQTVIWYPTAPGAGGPDAPLAVDGKPFPLVVFAHALGSYNTQSQFLTSHLASHGYVVAAPAFPLMTIGAPGGSTIADVAAQAGDVSFVIDSLLALANDPQNRFASGVDASRIGLSGHSGGALTTLVTTYDANLREPRIKAAVAFAPPACFLQAGYYDAARVPLLILQGDQDLLVDAVGDAGAVYTRAQRPKALLVVHGGTHIGFADVGATLNDGFVCSLFPDRTDLDAEIAALLATLGGPADHVGTDGCPTTYCEGDRARVGGPRQLQIGKEVALAFFRSEERRVGKECRSRWLPHA